MAKDPYVQAYADQFAALMKDKVSQMLDAVLAFGWENLAHEFQDPYDDDVWRLMFIEGSFYLTNTSDEAGQVVVVNLERLGLVP